MPSLLLISSCSSCFLVFTAPKIYFQRCSSPFCLSSQLISFLRSILATYLASKILNLLFKSELSLFATAVIDFLRVTEPVSLTGFCFVRGVRVIVANYVSLNDTADLFLMCVAAMNMFDGSLLLWSRFRGVTTISHKDTSLSRTFGSTFVLRNFRLLYFGSFKGLRTLGTDGPLSL